MTPGRRLSVWRCWRHSTPRSLLLATRCSVHRFSKSTLWASRNRWWRISETPLSAMYRVSSSPANGNNLALLNADDGYDMTTIVRHIARDIRDLEDSSEWLVLETGSLGSAIVICFNDTSWATRGSHALMTKVKLATIN